MNSVVSVASLASAAAVASPSMASTRADTELMRLGRQLDRVLPDWFASVQESAAQQAEFEAAVYRATGMTLETADRMFEESGARCHDDIDGELGEYYKTRHRIVLEMSAGADDEVDDRKWNAIRDRVDPVAKAIFALPATTVDGLGVKARAAMYINSEWWLHEPENGSRELVALVEDICVVAGVPGPAAALVCSTAVPTPSSLATTIQDDPIFAAIEAHRKAHAELSACVRVLAEQPVVSIDEAVPDEYDRLSDAMLDAALALCNVAPTTMDGVVALLRYSHEFVAAGNDWPDDLVDDDAHERSPARPFSWFLDRHIADAIENISATGGNTKMSVAEAENAPTETDLRAYCEWLFMEHRILAMEIYPELGDAAMDYSPVNTAARSFHFPPGVSWKDAPPPSSRALTVLRAVGVKLHAPRQLMAAE